MAEFENLVPSAKITNKWPAGLCDINIIANSSDIVYVKLAEKALVKMDNVTLNFDAQFAQLSKKEMDIAFVLYAAFSTLDNKNLKSGKENILLNSDVKLNSDVNILGNGKSALILKNKDIKKLCNLYTNTRRVSNAQYNEYIKNLKAFFRKAEFRVHTVVQDAKGISHTVEGTSPLFGSILDIDNGDALVVTLAPGAEHVFFDFLLPEGGFSKFELEKFISLRQTYSKILFYKLLPYNHRHGWSADIDEIKSSFGLDKQSKVNNFLQRINDYAAEVVNTGYFTAITPVIKRKNCTQKGKIIGIDFIAVPNEALFKSVGKKSVINNEPQVISVIVCRIIKDTSKCGPDGLPCITEKKEYFGRHIKCPICGSNVVHWYSKKSGAHCFACENSGYWANLKNQELKNPCAFYASTDPEKEYTLSEKKLKKSYLDIRNWLLDNTDWKDPDNHIEKKYLNSNTFLWVGKSLTNAMQQHNEIVQQGNKFDNSSNSNELLDDPPFPLE